MLKLVPKIIAREGNCGHHNCCDDQGSMCVHVGVKAIACVDIDKKFS